MLIIQTILFIVDPRFKLLPFDSERTCRRATDAVITLLERERGSTGPTTNSSTTSDLAAGPSSASRDPPLHTLASVASSLSAPDVAAGSSQQAWVNYSCDCNSVVINYNLGM